MNRFTLFATAALFAAAFLQLDSGSGAEDAQPKVDVKVQELIIQRRDTLRNLVLALRQRFYQTEFPDYGRYPSFMAASDELLQAELALAKTPDDVHALLKDAVETAKGFESLVEARQENGTVVLQARAERLRLEVELLKVANE